MQGSIAQAIALTISGNAFLQGRDLGRFWPDSSAFQFCRTVQFTRSRSGASEKDDEIVAATPSDWVDFLRREQRALRLLAITRHSATEADRTTVGFVGGGPRWIIQAVGAASSSLWEDEWRLGDRNASDRRIWDVRYRCIADAWTSGPAPTADLGAVRDRLLSSLEAIADFAGRNRLGYVESFRDGLAALSSVNPLERAYHKDLAPPGSLSLEALQLLGACQIAWVFGGMGSWNDGAYGQELASEGDPLSERLFDALTEALVATTNSSFRGVPKS